MNDFLNYLLLASVCLTGLPILVVFVECCAALLPRRTGHGAASHRPRVDVVIPAHDEAAGLPATLASIRADLAPGDRILVVADNCTDQTADAARAAGVHVLERFDPLRRGKGFALDYGVRHLTTSADEVVLFVDADCRVAPGTVDALARTAAATGLPVQANYVMTPPADPTPRDLVSSLAVTVKNQVRQRGVTALGGSCVLTGSGMAFTRRLLDRVPLAGDNLVEDMQLSCRLTDLGLGPVYCAEATVVAPLPRSVHASRAQRTRWEHGHLQTVLRHVPEMLARAAARRSWSGFVAAVDLAVPPLSLLVVLWGAAASSAALGFACGASAVPLVIAAASGGLLFAAVLLAQTRFGAGSLAGVLAAVPRYVASKLPIYATFVVRRQRAWVRTDRDAPPAAPHISHDPLVPAAAAGSLDSPTSHAPRTADRSTVRTLEHAR